MKKFGPSCLAGLAAVICSVSNIAAATPTDSTPAATSRVFIEYQSQKGEAVRRAIEQGQGVIHYSFDNLHAFSATLPDKAIEALSKRQDVVLVEEDPKRHLMQTTPYGVDMVQATDVWDSNGDGMPDDGTVTGTGVQVCVIDSGIDRSHEDFAGLMIDGDTSGDGCGHGTHVSGTIAAAANSVGVVGVSPGVSLYEVKVFGDSCDWIYSSTLVAAAEECVANGSNIISMSLGGTMKSRTEERAFAGLYDNDDILSVAAAGNDGNTRKSYPASYASVISVAAVDANKQIASFSQQNDAVEVSAPGVAVKSTVPTGTGTFESLTVAGNDYPAIAMEGSVYASATGSLVDCGLAESACPGGGGQVCLIERGNISFADKVLNCAAGGGVAAVIFNNVSGSLSGTLADVATTIPSLGISDTDGAILLGSTGASTTVTVSPDNYASWDGTSMATPHVSGVAALLWSAYPNATNAEIRAAIQSTAEDLGPAGRDNAYGFGLVQANLAMNALGGTPTSVNAAPVADFTYSCTNGTCNFTNNSSDPDYPDGNAPLTYEWNFGDNTASDLTNPQHTYSCDTDYTVTLNVTDDEGASHSTSKTVTPGGSVCNSNTNELTILGDVVSTKLKGVKFEISWTTSIPANSSIMFTCCGAFDDSTMTTSHSMSFNGSKGTTYTYTVTSEDADGNSVTAGPFTHQN